MSDYNFLMESRLSPEQHQVLTHLSRIAAEQGLNLYLVGGAVRDLTFGQQVVRDLDFVVEGNPQKIIRRLGSVGPPKVHPSTLRTPSGETFRLEIDYLRHNARLHSTELRFGGIRVELAMCRQEVYSKPGRRPEVTPAMIFDDLRRRDFSSNAMAVSLHPNSRGLLLDPTNGVADIERRELRVLHSRSFLEDPSRIYRLLRLGRRLDFKPEERTKQYLNIALGNRVWERMEPAQQGRELRSTLQEENPAVILKMYAERGLLAGLDKKLASSRIPYERFAKIRSVLRAVPGADPLLLSFHCLVQNLGGGHTRRLARKIIGERKAIKQVLSLDREARKLAGVLSNSKAALPSQVFTLLSKQPQILLLFLLVHYPQSKVQTRVKNFLFKYTLLRARLPRAELQALGVKPGPRLEKMLHRAFLEQLDGKIKTQQQLMKSLRALAGIKEEALKLPKRAKPSKPAPAHPAKEKK